MRELNLNGKLVSPGNDVERVYRVRDDLEFRDWQGPVANHTVRINVQFQIPVGGLARSDRGGMREIVVLVALLFVRK